MVPDDEKTERKNIRQDYKSFDKMILQLFGDEQELARERGRNIQAKRSSREERFLKRMIWQRVSYFGWTHMHICDPGEVRTI